jgi:excinuclease ABC subunit B
MYANKVTDSMKYAIDETERRRKYQVEYNEKHNITPRSIKKDIRESMSKKSKEEIEAEIDLDIEKLDRKQKRLLIEDLESKMLLAAENLQFEKAAKLRDEIKDIKLSIK